MIPDTIKQFRPKGTEIQEKSGHYYVHKVKGYYDKDTKTSKRKTLGCIGQIYPDIGFVPNDKLPGSQEDCAKEYGATRIIMETSREMFEVLRKYFPSEFIRIYALAVLKLLNNSSQKDIDELYTRSAISSLLPEVHLSKNTVSTFLSQLSLSRKSVMQFMREYTDYEGDSVIFDGSSFLSSSNENPYTKKGYTPGHRNEKQIRLVYAFNKSSNVPFYFRVFPGNIPDKVTFEACVEELGKKSCTVLLDKGFYSKKNIDFILQAGLDFIIPLQKNTTDVDETDKDFSSYESKDIGFFSYHKRIIFHKEHASFKHTGCKVHIFYDNERRKDLIENYYLQNQDENGNLPENLQTTVYEDTKLFGVTFLLTNISITPELIYKDYKTRWAIEEMFDTHKNTLGFKMNYETRLEVQEGWAFIEFLSLLMYYRINNLLSENDLLKSYSVKDVLFCASSIIQAQTNGTWRVYNMTSKLKNLFETLGVTIAPIP